MFWPTLAALLLGSGTAVAADWIARAGDGLVGFSAIQQRARFEGRFRNFEARVTLDPAAPASGRIEAEIDLASVDTDYRERDEYLAEAEWFHVARFPRARFVAADIRALGDGFTARGELTLRDVTRPVQFDFSFAPDGNVARLQGTAVIERLDFGVGTGDWADTAWVGNRVDVRIDLRLRRAQESANDNQANEKEPPR